MLKDFYFSQEHDDHLMDCSNIGLTKLCKTEVLINNIWYKFTEQLSTGHEPLTKHFNDLIFLGTADENNCRYNHVEINSQSKDYDYNSDPQIEGWLLNH